MKMQDHRNQLIDPLTFRHSAIILTQIARGNLSKITNRDLNQIEAELNAILNTCMLINQEKDPSEIAQKLRNIKPLFSTWSFQINKAQQMPDHSEKEMVALVKSLGKETYHEPNEGKIKLNEKLDPTKIFNWKEEFLQNAIRILGNLMDKLQYMNEQEHESLKDFKGVTGLRLRLDVAQLLSLLQNDANVLESLFSNVRRLEPKGVAHKREIDDRVR